MTKTHLLICSKKPEPLFEHYLATNCTADYLNNDNLIIGSQNYHQIHILEEIADMTRLMKSKWWGIQYFILNNNSISSFDGSTAREFINQAFKAIIKCLLYSKHQQRQKRLFEDVIIYLKVFLTGLVPLGKLNDSILLKINSANSVTCPYYQYLHTLLEIHYYSLIILNICDVQQETMEHYLNTAMRDLISIGNGKMCDCVKNIWLIVQLITEKIDLTGALFWKLFNKQLEKHPPLFSLNLLKDVALMQYFNIDLENEGCCCSRVKSNYEFLEMKLKEQLNQADCALLINTFRTIEPLLCQAWLKDSRINTYQIIWDFYSKRLNVSNKNYSNVSAYQLIENLDLIKSSPKDCSEDFEMFIGLLLYHLNEYPTQWSKIKGRIYSQLGPNKVKELNDNGINHLILLFLTLSTINFEEVQKKMLGLLENLPQEKKFSLLVLNVYGAIVLKYVREGRSIETITPPIISILHEAAANQEYFYLLKEFIKTLDYIVHNSSSMNLHQWLLFGSWLGKYQMTCTYAELQKSLNVIFSLLEKCSDADSWIYWEPCFKNTIYINLKQLTLKSTAPNLIGKIAGKLALLCPSFTTESFKFFNSENISPSISSDFLEMILNNYPHNFILTVQQENLILQSWIKICFLVFQPQRDLTKNVLKLDIFPAKLKAEIIDSFDPIASLIDYISKNNSNGSGVENSNVMRICDVSFDQLDKILPQYLIRPENEDVVLKSYRYILLLCQKCSALIYNRNKSITLFTKLIDTIILPIDLIVGKKTPHPFVLNAMRNLWVEFFKALISLRTSNDPYIERALKNMVIAYMPFFSTCDSPIVDGLQDAISAAVIFEKIYVSCLKPSSGHDGDINIIKSLKIINDFASTTTSIELFRLLFDKILLGLFEVVIFHSQRGTAIGTIKTITASHLFQHVKTQFKTTVMLITDKNIGLNTINYFQLMICLAKFVPQEIQDVLYHIKQQVVNVERLRGVGFDKTLRIHLEKLEMALVRDI